MYIYSDESGFWSHNEDPYYVRAWVWLSKRGNLQVEALFDHVKPNQEIKWSSPGDILQSPYLPKVECRIFVTVSPLAKFREQNFAVFRAIDQIEDSIFTLYRSVEPDAIKAKMKESTRQILFLSYQEKQHVDNAIDALNDGNLLRGVIIDTPQFTQSLYKDMVRSIAISKGLLPNLIKVAKSSDYRGIQFADLVAGAVNEYLKELRPSNKCIDFLRDVVKPRMLSMASSTSPNPNMVFWDRTNVDLISKFNAFRGL